MGVRVLALVVRKRLVGGWEIRRLEIRGWGVRERRSAGVGSLRDGSQLGQPGTVLGTPSCRSYKRNDIQTTTKKRTFKKKKKVKGAQTHPEVK